MSWLFGKKKIVPKVPFPEGRPFDERTLRFSKKLAGEKIIEPDETPAVGGLGRPVFPEEGLSPGEKYGLKPPKSHFFKFPGLSQQPKIGPGPLPEQEPLPPPLATGPLLIKVDVYREMLNEINDLRKKINELQETNKILEKSEYNEENNFIKLNRAVKSMHDRLLQMDKKIFKA